MAEPTVEELMQELQSLSSGNSPSEGQRTAKEWASHWEIGINRTNALIRKFLDTGAMHRVYAWKENISGQKRKTCLFEFVPKKAKKK